MGEAGHPNEGLNSPWIRRDPSWNTAKRGGSKKVRVEEILPGKKKKRWIETTTEREEKGEKNQDGLRREFLSLNEDTSMWGGQHH